MRVGIMAQSTLKIPQMVWQLPAGEKHSLFLPSEPLWQTAFSRPWRSLPLEEQEFASAPHLTWEAA